MKTETASSRKKRLDGYRRRDAKRLARLRAMKARAGTVSAPAVLVVGDAREYSNDLEMRFA